jgi:hypothetical protein
MSRLFKKWIKQDLIVRIPSDAKVKKGVKYKLSNQDDIV